MEYLTVKEIANKWNISDRSVRNYCAIGRIPGVYLKGKVWLIPEDAKKPVRNKKEETLLEILQDEKSRKYSGGIYHKTPATHYLQRKLRLLPYAIGCAP